MGRKKKVTGDSAYSCVYIFDHYLDLIFDRDCLWDRMQTHIRSVLDRDERYFEHSRTEDAKEVWRQMIDNMGGGIPLVFFAAMAFEVLSYRDAGHNIDAELEEIKARDNTDEMRAIIIARNFNEKYNHCREYSDAWVFGIKNREDRGGGPGSPLIIMKGSFSARSMPYYIANTKDDGTVLAEWEL